MVTKDRQGRLLGVDTGQVAFFSHPPPKAQGQFLTLQRLPSQHVHTHAVTTRDAFPTPTTRGLSGSSEQQPPSPLRCFLGQLAACRLVPSCVGLRLVRYYTASLHHLSSTILPHCVTQHANRYCHWAQSGHHRGANCALGAIAESLGSLSSAQRTDAPVRSAGCDDGLATYSSTSQVI